MTTGIIVPSEELVRSLDDYLGLLNSAGVVIRLFSNNHTPVIGDTVAAYTEATFSGYSSQTVGAWGGAVFSSSKARSTATTPRTFTNSTGAVGNTIYGYYVTDAGGSDLVFAHRPDNGPFDLLTAGKSMTVACAYTRGDDPAPN